MKGELLGVTGDDGTDSYIDLKTSRTYREKPVVFSYGGEDYGNVELLKVGETFHSRTRKAYASTQGLHKDSLCFYGFSLNEFSDTEASCVILFPHFCHPPHSATPVMESF